MPQYSIKELGQISGVQPHTIRIWEQRYGLLKPMRTKTNIRFYDDSQLKKLLNTCQLVNSGIKISHIGTWSEGQISAKIDAIIAEAFKSGSHFDSIVNQVLIAITTFDEDLFNKVFSNSISQFGMVKTYLKVIYPVLFKVGLMWCNDDIIPAQEHFLSNLIRQKLFSSIDALPLPDQADQTWVLFLSENEAHEIGLLFANYMLRQQGRKVIYLGADVPFSNLSQVVKQCKATHIYAFFVKNQPVDVVNDLLAKMVTDFKNVKILISGNKSLIGNISLNKNVQWIKEIEELLETVA